jgi:hypothetical protein
MPIRAKIGRESSISHFFAPAGSDPYPARPAETAGPAEIPKFEAKHLPDRSLFRFQRWIASIPSVYQIARGP